MEPFKSKLLSSLSCDTVCDKAQGSSKSDTIGSGHSNERFSRVIYM